MSALLIVAGCAVLVARPAILGLGPPTLVITAVFVALLAVALLAPLPSLGERRRRQLLLATVIGLGAFAVGRVVGGAEAPVAWSVRLIALNTLAAVAEEAFFRRLVYGVLAPVGAAFAIGGAAVLFALVHLMTYGAWVLPIDVAAGVLFGWQRWATNSWRVPAATHAIANVLVVL